MRRWSCIEEQVTAVGRLKHSTTSARFYRHWERRRRRWRSTTKLCRSSGGRRPLGGGSTLSNIGLVYWSLGEMQKALEKFNEALPIWRAVGDRKGRLSHSTTSAWSIGHWERRGRRWRSTMRLLPIWRAVGDRSGEAITLNNIGVVYGRWERRRRRWRSTTRLCRSGGR